MSFSKAKIQRFNDIKETTPSPADYNVKIKEKAKCAVIYQVGDKSTETTQSPAVSDASSNKSQPIFRTPTIPKRKKTVSTLPKGLNLFNKAEEENVECTNKDQYIKELTEKLEEEKNKSQQSKVKAEEVQKQYNHLSENYQRLNEDLEKLVEELNKEKHKNDGDDLDKLLNERHAYQISISTFQQTIEVLKNRLINSDRDVEQLKEELAGTEIKLVELENKCDALTNEIEKLKELNEEKDLEIESTIKFAENTVNVIEKNLLNKVDENFKNTNEKMIDKVLFMEVYEQLHQQQKINTEAHNLIEKLTNCYKDCENHNTELEQTKQTLTLQLETNLSKITVLEKEIKEKDLLLTQYKNKIEILDDRLKGLEEEKESTIQISNYYKNKAAEYESEVEEVSELRKKYIEQSGKFDELLQKYEILEKENADNKKIITEQSSLIGPFKEQLEAYELEKNLLTNEKNLLQNDAAIISSKYAEILGHQNHKQKIKHIKDLKEKNLNLTQSNMEKEKKIKHQAKLIEKLKKELDNKKPKKSLCEDKENLQISNCSLNESILSPIPLKNKN